MIILTVSYHTELFRQDQISQYVNRQETLILCVIYLKLMLNSLCVV